jgi:RNA polymerase sigma-70 factor (ECF subfamily)
MLRTLDGQVDADGGLVTALRRNDPDGAAQLVERYGERVYRLAARILGTADDAEEVAEGALLRAVRTIGAFRGDVSLGSWIDRLAAGAAYRKLLTRPATTPSVTVGQIALDDVLPPLDADGRHFEPMRDWSARIDADDQGELRDVFTGAVEALPADSRVALVAHDVEGMTIADIADVVGIGPDAVRMLVHRARLFVRKRLSERLVPA